MTPAERLTRRELERLARDDRGRHLLQLALRGIGESGLGLTSGCWAKRDGGVSGCLFQHAYWQGVQEGVFERSVDPPGGRLKAYVGEEDFRLVTGAIRAFDALGRRRFRRFGRGPFGLPVRRLDEERWRATVETILVDVLSHAPDGGPTPPGREAEAALAG